MKNKEKFAKEIVEIAVTGSSVAMRNGVLRECRGLCCSQCDFISGGKCHEKIKQSYSPGLGDAEGDNFRRGVKGSDKIG